MKRAKRRSLWGRVVRWGALVGVLAIIAVWALRRPLIQRLVVPRLEQVLAAELGLDVTIGEVDLDLSGRVTVSRFRAEGGAPRTAVEGISVERVRAEVSVLRLLVGDDGWFEKAEIEGPRVVVRVSGGVSQEEEEDVEVELDEEAGLGFRLPPLRLVDGSVVLLDGERRLELGGVSVRHDDGEVHVTVSEAEGSWEVPRLAEVDLPLRLRVHLQGRGYPWDRMVLSSLVLGSRDMVRLLEVDLCVPGRVRIEGDLGGWGVAKVAVVLEGDRAEVDAALRGLWPNDVLRLLAEESLPRLGVDGRVRLSVPLERPEETFGEADLTLRGVSSEAPAVAIESMALSLLRAEDGWIRGDLLVVEAQVEDLPPVDVWGELSALWDPSEGLVVATDDLHVVLNGVEARMAGEFRQRDLEVRDGFFDVVAPSVGDLAPLLPELAEAQGRVACTGSFRGRVLEEESWSLAGSLAATDVRASSAGSTVDVLAELRVHDCRLDLSRVGVCSEDVDLALALSVDLSGPTLVGFRDIVGRVGPTELASLDPPILELTEDRVALSPTRIRGRRGDLIVEARGRMPGELSGYIVGENLELPSLGSVRSSVSVTPGPLSVVATFFPSKGSPGEATVLPDVDGSLTLSRGRLSVGASRDKPLRLAADFNLEGQTLRLRGVEGRTEAGEITVKGVLPLRPLVEEDAPAEPARLSLVGRISDLDALAARAAGIRSLQGVLTFAANATGDVSSRTEDILRGLDVQLNARLSRGTVKFSTGLSSIQDMEGSLVVQDRRLTIRDLSGRMRSSSFDVRGQASFSYPWDGDGPRVRDVDVEVASPNLLIAADPGIRIRGTAGLRWHGPWEATKLDGNLEIKRAYFVQNISLAPSGGVSLPLELPSFDEPPLAAARFNVKVRSDHGIAVQNNLASTRASADLAIGGTGRFPVLTGFITTDEGTAFIGNSSIGIQSGVAEFSASDPMNPRLRVSLGKTVRGYDLSVLISGRMSQPEVLLTSSPPLKRETIVLLIMTGLTPGEIEDRGAERVAATQAAMFLGRQVMSEISGPSDPTEESVLDDIVVETESARRQGQVDPLRVEYRIARDVPIGGAEVFLQGERDTYEDYNLSAGIRFELK